jgi:hypothetical protein
VELRLGDYLQNSCTTRASTPDGEAPGCRTRSAADPPREREGMRKRRLLELSGEIPLANDAAFERELHEPSALLVLRQLCYRELCEQRPQVGLDGADA